MKSPHFSKISALENNSCFNSTWFVPIILHRTMCTSHVRAEGLATKEIITLQAVAEFLQEAQDKRCAVYRRKIDGMLLPIKGSCE